MGLFAPSVITGAYILAVLPGDILLLFVPDYSTTMCPSVLSERQFNYNQEHIKFLCNLAIAESNAFHILGVSGHCGGCKCINSMPVCAVQATTDSVINNLKTSCSPVLPAELVCLKQQLSIFTTHGMLELPKVARSCYGNSFIPGMSQQLAGMQLNHCCLIVTCVTCLLLICIQ